MGHGVCNVLYTQHVHCVWKYILELLKYSKVKVTDSQQYQSEAPSLASLQSYQLL
jgi:hypothetical protein